MGPLLPGEFALREQSLRIHEVSSPLQRQIIFAAKFHGCFPTIGLGSLFPVKLTLGSELTLGVRTGRFRWGESLIARTATAKGNPSVSERGQVR